MRLVPRSTRPRCAFCHGALRSAVLTCVACRTLIHEACELDRCPTLGCGSLVPWVLVAAAPPPRASWRRAAGLGVASALVVFTLAAPAPRAPGRPVEVRPAPVEGERGPWEDAGAPTAPPAPAPGPRAEHEWRLEGVVLDERGAPIAGADVAVSPCRASRCLDAPHALDTTVTDARGRYAFRAPLRWGRTVSCPRADRYTLVASAPGRERDFTLLDPRVCTTRPSVEVHPLQLLPERAPDEEAPVRRVVRVHREGQPVRAAWVRARGAVSEHAQGWTDRAGQCELLAPPAAKEVEVVLRERSAGASLTCVARIVSDGVTQVELPLLTGSIAGSTNHADRRVVFETLDGRLSVEAAADREGRFLLAVPAYLHGVVSCRPMSDEGPHCLDLGRPDPPPTAGPDARVVVLGGEGDVRLELSNGELRGRVVGATGFVVPRARVRAQVATGETFAVTADGDGRFAFSNLPAGPVLLLASRHLLSGNATVQVRDDAQDIVVPVR